MLRSCDLWLDYNGKAPRTADRSRTLDLSRQPTSDEVSAMVVRGLSQVGYAIEAGLPEAILWMQSGHAHDVAARDT